MASGLALGAPADADEAAGASRAPSKLKWHARGIPLKSVEQVSSSPAEPRMAEKPAVVQPAVQQAAARELPGRSPHARHRNSILQVGATSDEDPFGDRLESDRQKTADTQQEPAADEPTQPADQLPVREPMPLRSGADPFADEQIPTPPARENAADRLPPGDLSEGISTAPGDTSCKDYGADCLRAIRDLQSRDITKIVVGLVIEGVEGEDYPCDCKLGGNVEAPAFVRRQFARTCFTWKATGVCHKPLYFEDVQLERYGHSWNPVAQPFLSAAHFFVSVPLLPYKMGLNPPNECMYSLGYYRPGSCAPYMLEPIPFSLRAALFQGAGATAFAFWFWPG